MLDWLLVLVLFGVCGLLIARLDRVQTRTFAGVASIIDGDTLSLGGERVRLRGIDAFERGQTCRRAGTEYNCGAEARTALADLAAGRRLSCGGRTVDRYGRLLAVCTAGQTDLNGAMVDTGWAIAYGDYESDERRARAAKRGAWAGEFDDPADWRAAKGGPVEQSHDWVAQIFDLVRQLLWDAPGEGGASMKLYDGGRAPNPRRVRVFVAEKGIEMPPLVPVDMGALGHRSTEISGLNPLQRLPVLVLDDGTVLTESIAICRYFEALHPEPPLFGKGALGEALVEMWQRRMEFNLLLPVAQAFRHIHPAMKEWEVPQVAEWGEANKPKALEFLAVLDRELENREFAAGDAFSVADITGMIAVDFMKPARIEVPAEFSNMLRWYAALKARPSAAA